MTSCATNNKKINGVLSPPESKNSAVPLLDKRRTDRKLY